MSRYDYENDPLFVGQRAECVVCRLRKNPRGRSAPLASANRYCDLDCPGYNQDPQPGDLWPGERREDFGFPEWLAAVARDLRQLEPMAEFITKVRDDHDCASRPPSGGDDWLDEDEDDLGTHIDSTGCLHCEAGRLLRRIDP